MVNKIFKILSVLIMVQLIIGCVSIPSALSPEAKSEPGVGYVYGRFKNVHTPDSFYRHPRLVLNLQGKNNVTNYLIKFDEVESTTAIAVKPGIYNLNTLLIFWGLSDDKINRRETTLTKGPLTVEFSVEPGKAYYIGDFLGNTLATETLSSQSLEWKLESVKNNFENTTLDFKNKYPNLRELEIVQAIKFK